AVATAPPQEMQVFMNRGPGKSFYPTAIPQRDHSPGPVIAASAAADFDGDGDLDLAVVYGNSPKVLFDLLRNDTEQAGHWLKVNLRGTRSNRSALGAEVASQTGGFRQL